MEITNYTKEFTTYQENTSESQKSKECNKKTTLCHQSGEVGDAMIAFPPVLIPSSEPPRIVPRFKRTPMPESMFKNKRNAVQATNLEAEFRKSESKTERKTMILRDVPSYTNSTNLYSSRHNSADWRKQIPAQMFNIKSQEDSRNLTIRSNFETVFESRPHQDLSLRSTLPANPNQTNSQVEIIMKPVIDHLVREDSDTNTTMLCNGNKSTNIQEEETNDRSIIEDTFSPPPVALMAIKHSNSTEVYKRSRTSIILGAIFFVVVIFTIYTLMSEEEPEIEYNEAISILSRTLCRLLKKVWRQMFSNTQSILNSWVESILEMMPWHSKYS